MRKSPVLMAKFLGAACQRSLFIDVIDRLPAGDVGGDEMTGDNYCCKGHDLKKLIVHRFFNCVGKNIAKQLTYSASTDCRQSHQAKRRKIDKLLSTARN